MNELIRILSECDYWSQKTNQHTYFVESKTLNFVLHRRLSKRQLHNLRSDYTSYIIIIIC